jgi:hypothetical protein
MSKFSLCLHAIADVIVYVQQNLVLLIHSTVNLKYYTIIDKFDGSKQPSYDIIIKLCPKQFSNSLSYYEIIVLFAVVLYSHVT